MLSATFSLFALSAFSLLFSDLVSPSVARYPFWLVRPAASTVANLENTCQCDCCYPVGVQGRTECVPPIDTSFDVPVCSTCDVDACAARFPVACAQASSIVNSDCITRKGWMLQLVPIFFILITVFLLCYGFFFKRFDGYHDDRVQTAASVLHDAMPQRYNTFPDFYGQSSRGITVTTMDKASARSSSVLPPISEHEEMPSGASPSDGISATAQSPNQTIGLPLGEQADATRTAETTPQ